MYLHGNFVYKSESSHADSELNLARDDRTCFFSLIKSHTSDTQGIGIKRYITFSEKKKIILNI
jgi:hypothetical protein